MADDLIGYQLTEANGRVLTVRDPPTDDACPPGYVVLTRPNGTTTLRSAEQLRRHRQLSRQEGAPS